MTKLKTLCILTFLFSLITNAQITKGNWLVGGTGDFSTGKSKVTTYFDGKEYEYSGYSFSINPNIGYFIANKFATGLTSRIGYAKTDDGTDSGSWFYGAGPFARYYLLDSDNLVNILTHVEYYYTANSKSDNTFNSFITKLGPVIFFNSSVALELTANYRLNNFNSSGGKTVANSFDLQIGFQIHLEK